MDVDTPILHQDQFAVARGFEDVREIFEILNGRGYIAGSYAAYMASPIDDPIQPNDIDIFATSNDNAHAVMVDLCTRFDCAAVEDEVVYALGMPGGKLPVQIIKPHPEWKDFPMDILNSFDMDICRAILFSPATVWADVNVGQRRGKILRINNPLRVMKRVLKYHDRGVKFSDHELLKLYRAWDQESAERKDHLLKEALEAETVLMRGEEPADNSGSGFFSDPDDYFDGERINDDYDDYDDDAEDDDGDDYYDDYADEE